MRHRAATSFIALLPVLAAASTARADDDYGFSALVAQLQAQGLPVPNGAGVTVVQSEAPDLAGFYMPVVIDNGTYIGTTSQQYFEGKTFINVTLENGATTASAGQSTDHGIFVAQRFYRFTSEIPANAVSTIDVYEANDFLGSGFLHGPTDAAASFLFPNAPSADDPYKVINASWVGNYTGTTSNLNVLRRIDYAVNQYDVIMVAGEAGFNIVGGQRVPTETGGSPYEFFLSSYNTIVVGRSNNATPTTGSAAIGSDAIYGFSRHRPDISVDESAVSYATATVSSAATMLVQVARSNSITNGERSEVVRAALMAGANRRYAFAAPYVADYSSTSGNGLSTLYGAGQLNVQNSYNILTGGQIGSAEATGVRTLLGGAGFDYRGGFSVGNTGTYYFVAGVGSPTLSATLTWNLNVIAASPTAFNTSSANELNVANLANFDLSLYTVVNGQLTSPVRQSLSTINNSESINIDPAVSYTLNGTTITPGTALVPGQEYALKVERKTSTKDPNPVPWDYALAWKIDTAIPGDANSDGMVNLADLTALSQHFGLSSVEWSGGDFNGDGKVDVLDLAILSRNYGYGTTITGNAQSDGGTFDLATLAQMGGISGVATAAPEPATLAMIAAGTALITFRRRRRDPLPL